ncbi:hypothetical protein D3C71_1609760 [compost metagenome]
MVFKDLPSRGQHFVVIPWLGYIAVDLPTVDGCDSRANVRITREHHPRRLGPSDANLFEQLGSVHARHSHVRKDEIDG